MAEATPGGNLVSLQKMFNDLYATDGIYNKTGDTVTDWQIEVTLAHEVVHSALGIGLAGDNYSAKVAREIAAGTYSDFVKGEVTPFENVDNWVHSTFPSGPN